MRRKGYIAVVMLLGLVCALLAARIPIDYEQTQHLHGLGRTIPASGCVFQRAEGSADSRGACLCADLP